MIHENNAVKCAVRSRQPTKQKTVIEDMDVEEEERVVVAKPVASRPISSTFRSFSELLAGAINASSSSTRTTVSAIRPETVRFKPILNLPPPPPPPPHEFVSSQAAKSDKIYKPMAKLISKTTVSLLANMGSNSASHHQHAVQENLRTNLSSKTNSNTPKTEACKVVPQNIEEDPKALTCTSNGDGYNWRKYGQKQVKGSEYPRSYYKCTHPNCGVKKKVEKSYDGQIAEIVYKGEHNHSKPQHPKRNSGGGTHEDSNNNLWCNPNGERNEGIAPENSCGVSGECEEAGSKGFEVDEDEPRSKKRKNGNQPSEAAISEEGIEPSFLVQNCTGSEILGDGFRWRKYGKKVVKGNPYPRSYYRCTNIKCNVRKYVERAIDDPRAFVTTYEGKHNHEMPLKNTEKDSQARLTLK